MTNKQERALGFANDLVALMNRFRDLRKDTDELIDRWNGTGFNGVFSAMATVAQNPDGSLGSLDPAPVLSNPISVGALYRSRNQINAGVQVLVALHDFLNNVAVTARDRGADIDNLAG